MVPKIIHYCWFGGNKLRKLDYLVREAKTAGLYCTHDLWWSSDESWTADSSRSMQIWNEIYYCGKYENSPATRKAQWQSSFGCDS